MPTSPTWEETLAAPAWDDTQVPALEPEQMSRALADQGPANYQPMGQMTTTTEGLAEIANDPGQIPAAIMGAVSIPGQVAYNVAADVVSKVAGQPEYGGNILYGERQPWQELPVDKFLAEVAETNPNWAVAGRVGQSLSAMSPLSVVGMLPANLAKLAAAGFTVDMIRHAPAQFNAYAEEINKPAADQDADKLARLRSDIIQTFTFAPMAGAHALKGVPQEIGYALDLARENAGPRARPVPTSGRGASLPAEEGAPVPTWDSTEVVRPVVEGRESRVEGQKETSNVQRPTSKAENFVVPAREATPTKAANLRGEQPSAASLPAAEITSLEVSTTGRGAGTPAPASYGTANNNAGGNVAAAPANPPALAELTAQLATVTAAQSRIARSTPVGQIGVLDVFKDKWAELSKAEAQLRAAIQQHPETTAAALAEKEANAKRIASLGAARDARVAAAPVYQRSNGWEIVKDGVNYVVRDPGTKEEVYRGPLSRAREVAKEAKPDTVANPSETPANVKSPAEITSQVQEHVAEVASGKTVKIEDGGSKVAGKRAAKEIKSELVQRLEAALEKAPDRSSKAVAIEADQKQITDWNKDSFYDVKSFGRSKQAKAKLPAVLALYEKYGIDPNKVSLTNLWLRLNELKTKAEKDTGTVTIEIPGDGTFKIAHTKQAIGEVMSRAEKINTGTTGAPPKRNMSGPNDAGLKTFSEEEWNNPAIIRTLEDLISKTEPSSAHARRVYSEALRQAKLIHGETAPEALAQVAPGINTGNLGEMGMGGAKPGEFRNSPQTPTGIRNAVVDQERVKRGLPPAMEAARREFGTVWDEAMARIDQEPEATSRLVEELQAKPRALSDTENALLLHRQIELQNEYGRLTRDLAQAWDDSKGFPNRLADVEELKARVASTSDRLQEVYDVGKAVGTEQGRGLAARKMLAFEDYSLAKMEMEKRAAKGGGPLTDAERAEVTRLQERISQTEAEFQAYREKQEAARAERMTDEAIRDMQEELKRRPNYDSRIVKIAEEIVQKLEKQAVSAQERLKAKFARTNTGLDPTIIYDLGVVGAAKIARYGLDFGKFSAAMLSEYGDGVKDYLAAAWERANLHLENEGAKYGDKAPAIKNILRKRDATSKRENVIAGLKKGKAEGLPIQLEGDYIRKLAEGFVESGITAREALVDAVHEVLTKEVGLELTRRETMDAISGYGKFKPLNPNAIKATLRDLRGQMQQVAKLEDIQSRKPLQKTGVERRTPSDEERRLLQQVNEAKRRFGVVVDDPARQLKSALDAIKTRLKNQIADIEYQINTKERTVKSKTPSPFDAETKLLETRRDELKAQLDELLPKPGLPTEQQIAQVSRGIERSIADYERRIASQDVSQGPVKVRLSTPALEALRARRDALRAEWQELREANEGYQREQYTKGLERQKAALEESIKAKEAQLAAGPQPAAGRAMNRPGDPMLESLMQQRDTLNQKLAEARRKPEAQRYAEQQARRLVELNKQIAEREARFAAGDFSRLSGPKPQNRPFSPELEIAKQQLEAINAKIAEARRGPPVPPEVRALKALKTRLAQSTANYRERLAKHDFSKRPRNEPPKLDNEALRLKAENELAKKDFHTGLIKDRLANRTLGQKVYAGVKEALNLPRNLLSSWDVSAVLRQGGFIALGNPGRGFAALAPMFRALASEKAAVMVEQEILSRPNAPLYKQSKLYLAPHEALHLSAMEEAIMSRFAGKIPGLRASNRAYITYLNRLRADSFDALLASVARKDGNLTLPEMQAISNYINVATGRGDLGKATSAAETLATVFFSPRLLASRFQLLAGQPLYRGSARTRLAIAQEYGKFLAGIGVVYALGALAGATIEPDPRSSDFGKLKFGNTRVDILGGLSQASVLVGRLGSGETITAKGEVKSIRGDVPYGARTAADVIAAFLRSKLSPVVGTGVDIAAGKNVVGEPVTPKTVAVNMTVPLSFRDIYDVMAEQGMARGTILGVLSLFGFGLQQYDPKTTNQDVQDLMKYLRGVSPEQRDEVRRRLEESMKP